MKTTRLCLQGLPLLLALPAVAQDRVMFSIDWNSPHVGAPDCAIGAPITEGDILEPCAGFPALGPLASPVISISGGAGGLGLALHAGCAGHAGGTPCGIEVDALSMGTDDRFQPNIPLRPGEVWFSTDEFAVGFPGVGAAPNLPSEAPVGDGSADMMLQLGLLPPAPMAPVPGVFGHVGTIDGDGLPSGSGFSYPGLGLKEPAPALPGPLAGGDNLDAFNVEQPANPLGVFFSLDSGTLFFDACSGNPGTASAPAHGFVGGDVLVATGAGPALYAPAGLLGLDLLGGPDSDDLDALILAENGFGGYQVSHNPYDWMSGATDMLMFSVRRGSAVIGAPDSLSGLPIEEGDILIPPVAGGLSPFPAIWIPAENLGLVTVRSGATGPCGADELDALDHRIEPLRDCDANGVEDTIDIALGTHSDANMNGIPDLCEPPILIATPYCFCVVGPCANNDAFAGCKNSTGSGALLTATGSSSVVLDDLVLTCSQMPTNQFGIVYMGTLMVGPLPFGDGLRCAGGNVCRLPLQNSGAAGVISYGPGLVASTALSACPILAGATWNFQGWYRDPFGPCATGFNTSNAVSVTFY